MLLDSLFRSFRRRLQRKSCAHSLTDSPNEGEYEHVDPNNPFPDVVVIEFKDVIDLHSIPPRQIRAVVEDFIEEAHQRGVRWVRIIHGKGIGVQREIVRSVLARTPYVLDFRDAPAEAGGWGATVVTIKVDDKRE
jgi:dsDNA-specific endonuclease/ATPase MutS2